MPSYIAEEQRGTEARILNALFPAILQSLQLAHQAADQFGSRPRQPRVEHRPLEFRFDSRALESGGRIVLWKAQLFGVRTPAYVIPAAELSPDATCLSFHWAAD
ncbi:MAG TPA: hypothetical protein VFV66_35295 [Nonomuraea sp.]|nr:hypothetical protein [Nonomuraea sp.]